MSKSPAYPAYQPAEVVHIDDDLLHDLLSLVANGFSEYEAATQLGIRVGELIAYMYNSPELQKQIEIAYRSRGAVWHDEIIKSLKKDYDQAQVAGEKLRFEKLKFLAKVDHPERFTEKVKIDQESKTTVIVRPLSPQEARDILLNDPFASAISTTSEVVEQALPKEDVDESDML